jgi:SsrA-binding protein
MKNSTNIINRKAKFDFEFLDSYISGIQLLGSEVKSIRSGKISLTDSFCMFIDGELFVKNMLIEQNLNHFSHTANRDKKLLLNKKELRRLEKELTDGLTIIPYRVFINDKGLIKMEVVLAKGKKLYDKRQSIKDRELKKEILRNK